MFIAKMRMMLSSLDTRMEGIDATPLSLLLEGLDGGLYANVPIAGCLQMGYSQLKAWQ